MAQKSVTTYLSSTAPMFPRATHCKRANTFDLSSPYNPFPARPVASHYGLAG